MKKYKLIKMYPGIDNNYISVGDTFTEQGNSSYIQEEKENFCRYCVSQREVENNPEFWEEVKEKEWEIIRLEQNGSVAGTISKKFIEQYEKNRILSLWRDLWKIHSIKRLSDGEVFMIGDRLRNGTVSQFIMKGEELQIWIKPNENRPAIFEVALSLLEKRIEKEPLFISEEETYLYEGDKYWTVFNKDFTDLKSFTLYGPHTVRDDGGEWNTKDCKFFSKKENAVEFIEENKPKTLYGVNGSFTKTATSLANKTKNDYSAGNWKWFDSEKERDSYIEENKIRFSKKDMFSFIEYFYVHKEVVGIERVFSDWSNQVRKEK